MFAVVVLPSSRATTASFAGVTVMLTNDGLPSVVPSLT
jgi:hypothetical protein